MANKGRSVAKERYWRGLVRGWEKSGLTVRAFCAEQGVAEPNFYAWRRLLRERDAAAPRFVPVRVTPEPTADHRGGDLELVLGGGRVLRIGPGFDAATLQRLLAVLTEGQPC